MIFEVHLLRWGRPIDKLLVHAWLRGMVVISEGLRRHDAETDDARDVRSWWSTMAKTRCSKAATGAGPN